MNSSSHEHTALFTDLAPGLRILPLLSSVIFGDPVSSSKKIDFLVLYLSTSSEGSPSISIIKLSYSASLSPGKIGYPVYSSANIQPKLHISMAGV
jgi:hypothetical protein